MGPLCPCPNSKKAMKKGTRGISWGPLLTPGPRAVPEFPNSQSTPGQTAMPLVGVDLNATMSDRFCTCLNTSKMKKIFLAVVLLSDPETFTSLLSKINVTILSL
ncbi:unnamed protein product, partial [Staurois parvus]